MKIYDCKLIVAALSANNFTIADPDDKYIQNQLKNEWYNSSWWDGKTYWLKNDQIQNFKKVFWDPSIELGLP